MPVLFVLGAGCSRNYAQSIHRIRGLRSPLNHDFFKMAKLVIENTGMISDQSFMEDIELLIRTIAPLYGYSQYDISLLEDAALNLEEVMTLLDIDLKLFSSRTVPIKGLYESPQLRILKELLVRVLDYSLYGPPCRKHLDLARRMESGDVVLNFNYDILMDNALFSLGKMIDSGYCLSFFKVNQNEQWTNPNESSSEISLIKLHGSLNWIRCGFCGSLLLYQYRKQTMLGAYTFECPRCAATQPYAVRLMVPPIQSKEYGDKDISYLWIKADQMLRDFSKVVCIGYSFPLSDLDMISLMRRYRARRTTVPEVDFVSPDLRAKKRLESILGVKNTRRFEDLSQYLRSN